MKFKQIIPVLFLAASFFACSIRPSGIFSEKKMEAILYDVYIAEGEVNAYPDIFMSDSLRKQTMLNSVFKKHKIQEADFENSLQWYFGHLDRYIKINENLNKRFAVLTNELRKEQEAVMQSLTLPDVTRLPVKATNFFLTFDELRQNAYAFTADTILRRYGGDYKLKFNILGIVPTLRPVVTFYARCIDTTFVNRTEVEANGLFESSLTVFPTKQVKELSGSIYFPATHSSMRIFINDFAITQESSGLKKHKIEFEK